MLDSQARWAELVSAAQRLVEAYPNRVEGYEYLATAKRYTGAADEAISLYQKSIRLDPRDPNLFHRYAFLGVALLQVGRYEEAPPWLERSLAANPDAPRPIRSARYRMLATGYALSGHPEEARRAIDEANQLWPFATVRSGAPENLASPVLVTQMSKLRDGLRLTGLRDHADEDADSGVAADDKLHPDLAGLTPTTAPGATTIKTTELVPFLAERKPVVIDTVNYSWGRSIPTAVGLTRGGLGGSFADSIQDRLRRKMQELTKGDLKMPIVAVGWNSERFDGRNLALRLVALGYTQVFWYRGGREAWEVRGLPETPLAMQDW